MVQAIKALLKRPVAYHPIFAKITGSVPAAVMLSQGLYWQEKAEENGEDWFWVTGEKWSEQTGLSTDAQAVARKILRKTGFWREVKKGMPSRLFFQIDTDALVSGITEYTVSGIPGNKFTGIPRTSNGQYRKQESGNPGNIESNIESKKEIILESCANAPLAEPFTKIAEVELPENPIPVKAKKTPRIPSPGRGAATKKEKGEVAEAWTKTISTLFDRIGEEKGAEPFNWKVNAGRDFKALKEIRAAMAGDIKKKRGHEPQPQEIEAGFEYLFRYGFEYLEKIAREKGGAVQYSPQTIKNCYNQIVSYAKGNHNGGAKRATLNAATRQHLDLAVYIAEQRRKLFNGGDAAEVGFAETAGAV